MTKTRPRVFYGWWIVLISALGTLLGPVPIAVFSFGVFVKPLAQEFHASRGAVSLALTLFSTIVAFGTLFAGRLVDRFGPRKVILPFTFMAGFILISAYFCSDRIWQLYLFYSALGFASCGTTSVSYSDVISHWFDRHRGLALGLMLMGYGIGAFVMPSAAHYLIARFGWRLAFSIVGAAILLITAPLLTIFLKERPEAMGLSRDGNRHSSAEIPGTDSDPGLSWRETWRTPTFWLLFCAFVLVSVSVHGCLAHIASILADRGAGGQAAAFATSLFGVGLLVGRTGSGYLLDLFFAPRVAAVIFGCAAVGMGLLRMTTSQDLALSAAFLIGLGSGAETDIMAYLTSRYFGLRSFGAIYGFVFAGFALAQGSGAYLMGAAFDVARSYDFALTFFGIVTLIGAALMLRLGPYRYQKSTRDELGPALQPMLESEA
jgi:predicted MFS family arabinose efflux permease